MVAPPHTTLSAFLIRGKSRCACFGVLTELSLQCTPFETPWREACWMDRRKAKGQTACHNNKTAPLTCSCRDFQEVIRRTSNQIGSTLQQGEPSGQGQGTTAHGPLAETAALSPHQNPEVQTSKGEATATASVSPQTAPVFTKTEPLCPKNGACSSQKRSMFFPKTEPVLPKNGACSSQKRGMFFPKNGACSSQKRGMFFFPKKRGMFFSKTEHVFPENGNCFSKKQSFSKLVTDFPKVGGSFSQSRWLSFPKSVAHFPKVGGSFSQSRWLIFLKSVAHFPKVGGSFSQSR